MCAPSAIASIVGVTVAVALPPRPASTPPPAVTISTVAPLVSSASTNTAPAWTWAPPICARVVPEKVRLVDDYADRDEADRAAVHLDVGRARRQRLTR